MKKVLELLFSSKTSLFLLLAFAVAIGFATFMENAYDTPTARILVYNSNWFVILIALLVVNFIGSIPKYRLHRKEKLPGLCFHSAFVIIILGAACTRYFGIEGTMHIKEGSTSNYFYSSDPYLMVKYSDNTYIQDNPLLISALTDNSFDCEFLTPDMGDVKVSFKDYIKNATEKYEESAGEGMSLIEINVGNGNEQEKLILKEGELAASQGVSFSFNDDDKTNSIHFTLDEGQVMISSPIAIKSIQMPEIIEQIIPRDSILPIYANHVYKPEGTNVAFALIQVYNNINIKYVEGDDEGMKADALISTVSFNGVTKEISILGGDGYIDNFQSFSFGDQDLEFAYGLKRIELPFSIRLNKFVLDRYAGSGSPSSYKSEVTVIDDRFEEDQSIYMNNILDYEGYRFFQSSYDPDEKGTILSVNSDFYGTWISYLGYFLLTIGFGLTLFNKHSRYRKLIHDVKLTRMKRKASLLLIIGFVLNTSPVFSQGTNTNDANQLVVDQGHADKFGHLIVQTFEGRFAPVSTLAYDVMHKISRKDHFESGENGTIGATQVFLDLAIRPDYWKKQRIIYVREEAVSNLLGLQKGLVSFDDLFDEKGNYKLNSVAETAFRKKISERNSFDKEIIKLNERAEIFLMASQGNLLTVFPAPDSPNHEWINWNDELATVPIDGAVQLLNADLDLPVFNYKNLMMHYLLAVVDATESGDYSEADKALSYIEIIQNQSSASALLPSKSKIEKEVYYNNANIFGKLRNTYALLGIILLMLAFISNLKTKRNNVVEYSWLFFTGILAVAFLYHTFGMGLRWYISGHAPWSNGYEALILVAWASLLAGFGFVRYSKITLGATTFLAFFALMTAGHSNYDPQLTNLQPVLKSNWLIIHVATLTVSYGFLGLSFFLGLVNMCLLLFRNAKNVLKMNSLIKELTQINEISVTIGLFLATVGTFLGGIWANESWGRYWGWDSKEAWALVIVIAYTIILHFRLVPFMKSIYTFNLGSILAFSTVLMTFFGVNYYFTKGLHTYASGDTPAFPIWAWVFILGSTLLIIVAGFKSKKEYLTPKS